MQRYRINYNWLIGVFATSLVLAVVSFFVWRWQVERKADYFLSRAEASLAEKKPFEALESYRKYVKFRPDEVDVRIKMAETAIEVFNSSDVTNEEQGFAWGILDQTVRVTNDSNLRRSLAEIVIGWRPQDTIKHVESLLEESPEDSELNTLYVRALYKSKDFDRVKEVALPLIGYDKSTDKFDDKKIQIEGASDVYSFLSNVLAKKSKDAELARRVIDQMILANPDSAEAYLQKSTFLSSQEKFDEAIEALDKAYEIDPLDEGILLRKGWVAQDHPKYSSSMLEFRRNLATYERILAKIASKKSASHKTDAYEKAHADYEKAIENYEKSRPSYEEARTHYQEAKSAFQEELSQLVPQNATRKEDASLEESLANLEDSLSQFEKTFSDHKKALSYFVAGRKEYPEKVMFYRFVANAQMRLGQKDEALKTLRDGVKKFKELESIDLVLAECNIHLEAADYPALERGIKRLTNINHPSLAPIIDFLRARIFYSKKQWGEASIALKRVRPRLLDRPGLQKLSSLLLGASYENQGVFDLAKQAYGTVLKKFPKDPAALQGLARVGGYIQPKQSNAELEKLVNLTLEYPEDRQDWSKVEELVEKIVVEQKLPEARQKLLRAKILMRRDKFSDAKILIRAAAKEAPDDIDVHFAAVLLVFSDPAQGSEDAIKLLDRLEKKWGRSLRSLAQRADIIATLRQDDVSEQLLALIPAAKDLSEREKDRLERILGLKFEQLGNFAEARKFYEKSIQREPNNLPLRMHMFDLALREQNDAAMQKAQESILELKTKDDASYLLTEVKRRLIKFTQKKIDRKELARCRTLLDKALKQRGEWHELYITYGQLLLLMNEDIDLALQYFDKALEYGPAKSNAVGIQVRLLAERGLNAQARERMDRLSKANRGRMLGKLEADLLMKTGDQERGYLIAERLAASQPKNSGTQFWFSKIAQQVGKLDVAANALYAGVQIDPTDPANWIRLVGLNIEQKKIPEAEKAMREAQLFSEAEFLPLLTAKIYEQTARWESAEIIYLASYAGRLEEVAVARRLADFYLAWVSKDEANLGKASKHINLILRAANEGRVKQQNPHVIWARQRAAKILLSKQSYLSSIKAERLLRQSLVDGVLGRTESELLADILIARNDPESIQQTVQLLSGLRERKILSTKGTLQLAQLLGRTHQWDESQDLLLKMITKYPKNPLVRAVQVELLIDQENYSQADRSLKRLHEIDPRNSSLVELSIRLASEKGDMAELSHLLSSLVPKKMLQGPTTPEKLQTILGVAQLATRYGDNELAEKLLRLYTQRKPDDLFHLTRFLAYHGDCGEALQNMKRLFPDRMDDVIQLANRMMLARRDEFGDQYDEQVDQLINASLRDDPDSISRQVARAVAYETQGKNKQSIATYERLLKRDDLTLRSEAAVKNNLGFQLALLGQDLDKANQIVEEAMATLGPVEDMLDTRAIVRIAQKKYDLAAEDMELALSVSRDPVKQFHLAKAYSLAGNGQAAKKAWKKALSLGFKESMLSKLEKPSYETTELQIKSFQP